MRRALKWIGGFFAAVVVVVLALTVFGGFRLKDPQGNVAFGWDSARHRFQIMEKPRLMLEGPHVFPDADGYQVIATEPSGEDWRLSKASAAASTAGADCACR